MTKRIYAMMLLFLGLGIMVQAQDEKSAADLYTEAEEFRKAKDYAAAFPLYEQAIAKAETAEEGDSIAMEVIKVSKKNGVRTAYYLGTSQRKAKDYEAAIATFDKGLAMGEFYALYGAKAQAMDKMGKKEEAVEAYILAGDKYKEAGQDVSKYVPMYRKAISRMYTGKAYSKVIEVAAEREELAADAGSAYYIAKSYNAKKNYAKALEYADKAIAALPEGTEAKKADKYYMLLGDANSKLSKKSEAIAAYKKVSASGKYGKRAAYLITELEK
ncbi:MAG: tetratricopeptide repeat protein [Bacteroidota bacterium]